MVDRSSGAGTLNAESSVELQASIRAAFAERGCGAKALAERYPTLEFHYPRLFRVISDQNTTQAQLEDICFMVDRRRAFDATSSNASKAKILGEVRGRILPGVDFTRSSRKQAPRRIRG